MADVDLAIAADGEATLPALIEAVKRLVTGDRRRVFEERGGEAGRGQPRDARTRQGRGQLRMGCEPGQHRSSVCRDLGADQARRLVARLELLQRRWRLAEAAVGFQQAVSLAGRCRRRRHRLRRARLGRRRARQPEARAAVGGDPDRRRSRCTRRACCGPRRTTRFRCSAS